MQINNIHQLRNFVAEQLERLCEGDMEPEKANACAMLSANMLLSCRLEMEYARLKNESPLIPFMENSIGKVIESTPQKRITSK